MSHTISLEINNRILSIELNKIGKQADGSALVRYGDTIMLVTCTHDVGALKTYLMKVSKHSIRTRTTHNQLVTLPEYSLIASIVLSILFIIVILASELID